MKQDVEKALSEHIKMNVSAVPLDIKDEFCKVWPTVKQGLQLVENILKAIPGGAIAIPFIDAAISIGDLIHKNVCGS